MVFKIWRVSLLLILILPSYSLAVKKQIHKAPFLRFSGDIHVPKINSLNTYLAFTDKNGFGLNIVQLTTGEITEVSKHKVSHSYFWSPNGYRIFYKEMYKEDDGIKTEIKAYDLPLEKSISIDKIDGVTGSLSFDPRDFRFYIYHNKGIIRHQIQYPGERLARWQIALKNKVGYWISTDNSIIWVSHGGISMRKLNSGTATITSFDISPDGKSIVWADDNENIYLSEKGQDSVLLAHGLDPKWHPDGNYILYSHARFLANKVIGHDIRIMNKKGVGKFLTKTLGLDERYPVWLHKSSSILYTHKSGTDIFEVSFRR